MGRPKQINFVTVDQAVKAIRSRLREKYNNEAIVEKKSYKKRSLYNLRSQKRLTSYGDKNCALFDLDEILKKLVK